MIINIILINCILYQATSVILQGNECSCEDYTIQQCNNYSNCSINGFVCGDLICKNRNYDLCTSILTNYKCKWDESSKICIDYNYKCAEIPQNDCSSNSKKQQNCHFNQENGQCEDISCNLLPLSDCPRNLCYYDSLKCSDPIQNFDCSTLEKSKCEDFVYSGTGQVCHLNNLGICKSYNIYKLEFSCRDWSDAKKACEKIRSCIYDDIQQLCRDPKCFEIKNKDTCIKPIMRNDQSQSVELCKWNGDYCQDLAQSDLAKLTESECQDKTAYKYSWKANICQKCKNIVVVDNPCDNCCGQGINSCNELKSAYPSLTNSCQFLDNCKQLGNIYSNSTQTCQFIESCDQFNNTYFNLAKKCYKCLDINSCNELKSVYSSLTNSCQFLDNCKQLGNIYSNSTQTCQFIESCNQFNNTYFNLAKKCYKCLDIDSCNELKSVYPSLTNSCQFLDNCDQFNETYFNKIKSCQLCPACPQINDCSELTIAYPKLQISCDNSCSIPKTCTELNENYNNASSQIKEECKVQLCKENQSSDICECKDSLMWTFIILTILELFIIVVLCYKYQIYRCQKIRENSPVPVSDSE